MTQQSPADGGLVLLAEAFRSKRTGTLVLGRERGSLRAWLEAGQIVALGPAPAADTAASLPKPNDSVRLRLERVLSEIGMRPPATDAEPPPPASLRDRLIERLGDEATPARFEEATAAPPGLLAVAVATEPLILEAVRQLRDDDVVRRALGDLDQRLRATTAFADERTLTLTEGYLLSRIDGLVSAREVLQLVPLDPRETERSLLGLVLTGRVECRPAPVAAGVDTLTKPAEPDRNERPAEPLPAEPAPAEPPATGAEQALPAEASAEPARADAAVGSPPLAGDDDVVRATPDEIGDPGVEPIVEAVPDDEADAAARAPTEPMPALPSPLPVQPEPEPVDPRVADRRREIVAFYQSLPFKQNHFDMLGVEPGCTDEEVKRAYFTLTKRYHPDANRDKRLHDLHDMLEAIFIRVGEAWEVIGEARSRASYAARAGILRRPHPPAATSSATPAAYPSADDEPGYVPPEEILQRARHLLAQARYWDVIQLLENSLPSMEPPRQQHRGRLLLARAYSKNPNWLRRAEEMLQQLVREDPTNADAHYELGLVYKTGGLEARAQAMFRRALELRPGHKEAAAELGIQTEAPAGGGGLLKRLFKRGKAS